MPARNPNRSGHLTRLDTSLTTFAGTSLYNSGGAAPFVGAMESYVAAGGAAWYRALSISHRLSSAYTGPLFRVRRSTGGEQDVPYDAATNQLDTVSLGAFCAGANGFVVTPYDQSGNARDVTQATANDQPKIWDSVTGLLMVGSLPCTTQAPSNQTDTGDGWSRGDYSGFTGGTNPALTLASWFRYTSGHLVAVGISKIGGSGLVVQLAVRLATPTLVASCGPTIPNSQSRDFTPAETLTNGGYVVMQKALNANISAATMRQNGIALSQSAVVAGLPSLAGNLSTVAAQAVGFNFVGNWNSDILIPEVPAGAALTALETSLEAFNVLAGV